MCKAIKKDGFSGQTNDLRELTDPNIHFIVIGAQKAGTTWLYHRLKEVPEFSLPYVKEIHYFDRSIAYPSPNKLSTSKLKERLKDLSWVWSTTRPLIENLLKGRWKRMAWYFRWYYSDYNDIWYTSLFKNFKGVCGDVTPAYSMLSLEDVEHMYRVAPKAKVIFMLRNPVDRAWSHFRHEFKKRPGARFNDYSLTDIIGFLKTDGQKWRSDYEATLSRYAAVYPKDQILIGFYDAIIDRPDQLLKEVANFIVGVHIDTELVRLRNKSNVSPKIEMPHEVRLYLQEKYRSQIENMAELFGGYCKRWVGTEVPDSELKATLSGSDLNVLYREGL